MFSLVTSPHYKCVELAKQTQSCEGWIGG